METVRWRREPKRPRKGQERDIVKRYKQSQSFHASIATTTLARLDSAVTAVCCWCWLTHWFSYRPWCFPVGQTKSCPSIHILSDLQSLQGQSEIKYIVCKHSSFSLLSARPCSLWLHLHESQMEEQHKASQTCVNVTSRWRMGEDVFINLITIALGNLSRHAQEAADALAVR